MTNISKNSPVISATETATVPVNQQEPAKKYEFTGETIEVGFKTLHRIRALRDFGDVKKGDLGGFIQGESNLSHDGDCWVGGKAKVYSNARVYDNAIVSGYAHVNNIACIYENARVYGKAVVAGNIYGNAHVFDKAIVYNGSNIYDNAKVSGSARVGPCAEIHDNAHVSGKAQICQFTTIYGNKVLKENMKFSKDVCGLDQDVNKAV